MPLDVKPELLALVERICDPTITKDEFTRVKEQFRILVEYQTTVNPPKLEAARPDEVKPTLVTQAQDRGQPLFGNNVGALRLAGPLDNEMTPEQRIARETAHAVVREMGEMGRQVFEQAGVRLTVARPVPAAPAAHPVLVPEGEPDVEPANAA